MERLHSVLFLQYFSFILPVIFPAVLELQTLFLVQQLQSHVFSFLFSFPSCSPFSFSLSNVHQEMNRDRPPPLLAATINSTQCTKIFLRGIFSVYFLKDLHYCTITLALSFILFSFINFPLTSSQKVFLLLIFSCFVYLTPDMYFLSSSKMSIIKTYV